MPLASTCLTTSCARFIMQLLVTGKRRGERRSTEGRIPVAKEDKRAEKRKVHVTAEYPSTAKEVPFVAERDRTVAEVISEAYQKLGESPRAGDQHFCGGEPRVDLGPHKDSTLAQLEEREVCLRNGRGKLEMHLEIEAEPGGACAWMSHR